MTPERGFRRIVVAVSGVVLAAGAVAFVALSAASAWSLYLDHQMAKRMTAEGCPSEIARPGGLSGASTVVPVVTRLSQSRWRVAIRRPASTSFYVVKTPHELTNSQLFELADRKVQSTDFMTARWEPMPQVEIVDCLWATHEIGEQNRATISSRLVDWWMGRAFVWVVLWPIAALTPLELTLVPAIVASPLILAGGVAALVWGLFYVARWIVYGFAGI